MSLPSGFHSSQDSVVDRVHGPHCWPGDVNGDGHADLIGCTEWSVYPVYAHAALEMDAHPTYEVELIE